MKQLKTLHLDNNKFGALPAELSELTRLATLRSPPQRCRQLLQALDI